MAISNLTGQKTYQSFRNLMQISSSGQVYDGLGNLVTSLQLTASFVSGSSSGGGTGAGFPFSGSAVITGSLNVTQGITGSLFGTASYATNALTASYLSGYVSPFPYTGSAKITGSLEVIGPSTFKGNQTITGSLIQGLEGNIATGENSHAEGSITKAIGNYSHAEGDFTQAKGDYSHAEGQETIASGSYSHAEGYQTIALADHQHVQGHWNATSLIPAAFIVGNGTDDSNRSNLIYAHDSTVEITGSLGVNGGITGSLFGTSSWASNSVSSSFAVSSSRAVTASLALTASFAQGGNGSFSGSFSGSGANLNSIPTTAIAGNFTQIATGSVTASVTPTQFSVVSGSMTEFLVTGTGVTLGGAITDTHRVTGSLLITGSNTVIGNETITGSLTVSSSNATQFLVGNSNLFVSSSGNIGIGTTTPINSIDIQSNTTGSLRISGSGGSQITLVRPTSGLTGFVRYFGSTMQIGTSGNDGTAFYTTNTIRMFIDASPGNIGIGTTAPNAKLDISGSVNISGSGTQVPLQITSGSTSLLFVSSSGRVGIGTTTPSSSLDVSGSARITNGLTVTGSTTSTQGFIKPGAGSQYLLADGTTTASTGGSPFPYTGSAQITGSLNVVGPVNITGSLTQGFTTNQATGLYSHAEGVSTIASGAQSHAEGVSTIASGSYSHAEGQYNNATGQSSHAEGAGTQALGNASHAEGGGTIASGAQSHAEGLYTDALGSYSHAEGLGADIEYNYSTLSTNANIVFGPVSSQVSSITYNSVAVNGNFTGSISYPYTINDLQLSNTDENNYYVAVDFGYPRHNPKPVISSATHNAGLNITTFTLSTPFLDSYASLYGYGYASGSYSHTEGNSAKAIGSYSHAEGKYTVSSGEASHAEGFATLASGDYSHAAGFYTYAKGAYQSVVGQYNQTSSVDSAFIVGNGTATNARSNLVFAAGSQVQITGSLRVSGSITGSLFGTASYATNAANGGVTSIIAGANVQVSNTTGDVTVSALITNLGLSQAFYQGLQNIF